MDRPYVPTPTEVERETYKMASMENRRSVERRPQRWYDDLKRCVELNW